MPADPYMSFNFLVEIDSVAEAGFQECSGLDSTTESAPYREGGENTTVRKLMGKTTYSEITLKRRMTDSDDLWNWRKNIVDGIPDRRNISIVLLDSKRQEVKRWNVDRAWPSKWEGPSLNATGTDAAIEGLTITHEGIARA